MAYERKEYNQRMAIWFAMISRCENPLNKGYNRYGGRGIKVCKGWHDRNKFWEDMGAGYASGLSLERIDNDGDYEPSNCRWASPKEQALNRRSNRLITIGGVTKPLSLWIESTSLKPSTVRQRYYVYGWSAEKALGVGG